MSVAGIPAEARPDLAVRTQLAHYLAADSGLDLKKFQQWFIPFAWENMDNPVAAEVIGQVELALAEFTSGHSSENELCQELRPLVEQYTVAFSPATVWVTTGSFSSIERQAWVGTPLAAVFS